MPVAFRDPKKFQKNKNRDREKRHRRMSLDDKVRTGGTQPPSQGRDHTRRGNVGRSRMFATKPRGFPAFFRASAEDPCRIN
jgi:hypothetical protein